MFKQRPKPARLAFNRHARIQFEGSGAGRDCLIITISDDGVRLYSETADIPPEFTLVMPDVQPPRRPCRVIWRLGFEFGAKFTDATHLERSRPRPAEPWTARDHNKGPADVPIAGPG